MNKDTIEFLQQLSENNSKEWMVENRTWYEQTRNGFLLMVGDLLDELLMINPGLQGLRPKDCTYRQNRDVRFSANKNPYKINMGAYFSPQGKKSPFPGYYLHVEPGACFLAGGLRMPDAETLKKIRQEIDYSGEELQAILHEPEFRKAFGPLSGPQLKTSPKGYEKDHQYIDLLRFKGFLVRHPLTDEQVLSDQLIPTCMEYFQKMNGFIGFLNRAVQDHESGEGLLGA